MFAGMMKSLFKEKGSEFRVELVADPAVQEFVSTHASALDSAFKKVEMSDAMRRRLTRSNFIFSGMKAFHELHEAFPSLLDENGNRKPFERFLNDVQSIDSTYNANYLRAEYNFVAASAEMAGRWEQFMRDGDRYNLQYRTQRDDKVRPEHAALDRVTLPPSDSFWEEFYPPNGWNCRCTVVQVRKSKYPATSHDEAMRLGDEALQRDTKGIFRFNAGKEGKSVPDYNPYTIRRCSTCPIAKGGKGRKLEFVPDNEVCQACVLVHQCEELSQCTLDEIFGKRLRISNSADKTEIHENTRAARSLLTSFPKMEIKIREHILGHGIKNHEYLINGLIGDRKGIRSINGVSAGFNKAIKQGCEVVVIDLDMHMHGKRINLSDLASKLNWRNLDFSSGRIKECYIIHRGMAVRIGPEHIGKDAILAELQKIKP